MMSEHPKETAEAHGADLRPAGQAARKAGDVSRVASNRTRREAGDVVVTEIDVEVYESYIVETLVASGPTGDLMLVDEERFSTQRAALDAAFRRLVGPDRKVWHVRVDEPWGRPSPENEPFRH
jgi:hypothetical protein